MEISDVPFIRSLLMMTNISSLSKWRPTFAEIEALANTIVSKFTLSKAANTAFKKQDDWLARSILFMRCCAGDCQGRYMR